MTEPLEAIIHDAHLSPREAEVLLLSGRGLSLREIAAQLGISLSCARVMASKGRRKLRQAARRDALDAALLQRFRGTGAPPG